MNGGESAQRPGSADKNRESPAGSSQWFMYALNRINDRLDRIEEDVRALGKSTKDDIQEMGRSTRDDIQALGKSMRDDVRALGKSTRDDIRALKGSVDNVKKVIWTVAGLIIAIGLLGSFLFELGDLVTGTPFEITIRNPPGP